MKNQVFVALNPQGNTITRVIAENEFTAMKEIDRQLNKNPSRHFQRDRWYESGFRVMEESAFNRYKRDIAQFRAEKKIGK